MENLEQNRVRGGGARQEASAADAEPGGPPRGTGLRGRAALRLGFYATILALALIRFSLNPPVQLPIVLTLVAWYATAGLYFALRPREPVPGCLTVVLRWVFFAYEASAVVVVMHHLGGSGWLTLLLLVYPVSELNILSPGRAGFAGSLLAILACTGMVAAEAFGWLPHDPFYAVSDPLYRQTEYVLGVLIVACFTLFTPATAQLRNRS
ncbi:MAG: hypothetical protein GTO46_16410 [Gemmatimonadetes bacterium]|nr:hypothetical protein [Gemmatimonadota bacterium]NIO33291.1 hypothetical protein [Gemmatimonadota bacterium]